MPKKNCLITGATSGLGKELAIKLSARGYNLILVGSSSKKIKMLKKNLSNKTNQFYIVDFTKIDNVKKFLYKINKIKKIDLVINNAGALIYENKILTKSKSIVLNYVSHIYLTEGLLNRVINSKDKKIIFISSHVHRNININKDFFDKNKIHNFWNLYKLSKLLLTTHCYIFKNKQQKINLYSINPGRLSSNFRLEKMAFISSIIKLYLYIFGNNPETIAVKICDLVLNRKLNKKNLYFDIDKNAYPNRFCLKRSFQKKVWNFYKSHLTNT